MWFFPILLPNWKHTIVWDVFVSCSVTISLAALHKVSSMKIRFNNVGLEELKCPAASPDLNPSEHLWRELEPTRGLQDLVESHPRRVELVINNSRSGCRLGAMVRGTRTSARALTLVDVVMECGCVSKFTSLSLTVCLFCLPSSRRYTGVTAGMVRTLADDMILTRQWISSRTKPFPPP